MNTFGGLVIGIIIGWMIFGPDRGPRDSTDPLDTPNGLSGMALRIDAKTGCHYLSSGWGGALIPRVDKDGNHACVGREWEPKP